MTFLGALLTFGAFVIYAIVHSILASMKVKAWATNKFGAQADRSYRFAYNVFAGVTFLPVLAIPAIYPGETLYQLSSPWSGIFVFLQLVGAAIILIGMLQTDIWHFLGLRQLLGQGDSEETPMVTAGLYRYMRHPLYTGGLLFIWFIPLMTTSLLSFNIAASIYLYIGSIFEERRLITAYGAAYLRYQQSVPRFFPKLRLLIAR